MDSENQDKDENLDEDNHEVSSDDGSDDKKAQKGTKRPIPAAELDDDKKAERRAANRRSAFQSRQRRKILIDDLQRTVAALSKDNGDLRRSHDEMRSQLEAALLENHQLRMQQQLTGMGGMTNPAALLGVQAMQQAQAQASLLRGVQLLASGGSSGATGGITTGSAAVAPTEDHRDKKKSQEAESSAAPKQGTPQPMVQGQASSGIQGILNAASAANGLTGNAVLQQILQSNPTLRNSPLSGLTSDALQLAGIKGLLEQLGSNASSIGVANTNVSTGPSTGNVSDALRAILQAKCKQ